MNWKHRVETVRVGQYNPNCMQTAGSKQPRMDAVNYQLYRINYHQSIYSMKTVKKKQFESSKKETDGTQLRAVSIELTESS
jgi:hypothetical protein